MSAEQSTWRGNADIVGRALTRARRATSTSTARPAPTVATEEQHAAALAALDYVLDHWAHSRNVMDQEKMRSAAAWAAVLAANAATQDDETPRITITPLETPPPPRVGPPPRAAWQVY